MNRFNTLIHSKFYHGGGRIWKGIIYRLVSWYYHCDIPCDCKIDGVYFNHRGFGIVISPEAIIGKGTSIQHSVTIGVTAKGEFPIIGDNCYIGARACIIGTVKIGNNVKVGAGAVVVKDVPDGCTVVGVPARVVKSDDYLENGNK